MSFKRQHGDLSVRLVRHQLNGRIIKADLQQHDPTLEMLQLTAAQLYALVDDVAVADPDEWARRFPPQEETELALRRVADYFRERARVNRQMSENNVYVRTVADTFDLALTRVMEEIESLYPDGPENGAEAVNGSLNRHDR